MEVPIDALRYDDVLSADWVTAVVLALLLGIAWVNILSPGHWWSLIGEVLGLVPERQTGRSDGWGQDRMFLVPIVVGVLTMGLLLWQLDTHVRGAVHRSYAFWSGVPMAVIMVHLLATRGLVVVLRDGGILGFSARKGLRSFAVAGLLLLPVVVVVAYRPEWRWAGLMTGCVVLMAALVYRWVQVVRTGWISGVPLRFIMIYLCTAEIVPVLLLVQVLRPPVRALSNL
jgi:hypothetical protein